MPAKLSIRILGREAPFEATVVRVASLLPSSNFEGEGAPVLQTPPKTLTLQDTDLDFGHVKPAGMFRRVVKLNAAQERAGSPMTEYLLKAGADMRIAIVQNQVNALGARAALVGERRD